MTSIQEAVKQQIVAIIQSVPNTGQVYDRVKYSSSWQNFKDQFTYLDPQSGMQQIRGWWVTIPSLNEGAIDGSSFDMHWHNFTYPIHGIMSYSDKGDTEPAFDEMLWSVFESLHSQGVLGLGDSNSINGASVVDGSIEVQVPMVDMRMFGSILCHHAELRMTVAIASPTNWVP